jgi:chromate transport protein ChrA
VWVVSTTYLKHTDKENPETVKAMVKMQASTMLYKMGLSHFSLFIYCLFLLWFCRLKSISFRINEFIGFLKESSI